MKLLGYIRISAPGLDASLQLNALMASDVSVHDVFSDVTSRARDEPDRPGLTSLLEHAAEGDTVVVWRIDRLGRSFAEVLDTAKVLSERGINLRSLQDGIDPDTTCGLLMLNLLASLAEYDRELAAERRNARAIATARKADGKVGRPPVDPNAVRAKLREVHEARASGLTAAEAARLVGWSRPTYYRHLKQFGSQS